MFHRRGFGVVAALSVAFAVAVTGVANAQYFGQNKVQYRQYDWRSIQSDHFEIYFYPGSDSLAMRALDLAEKTNAVFSPLLGHRLSKRIPIILYGSHNDFSQTNITPELIEGSTGGFTEVLRDRVVIPFAGSYEDFRHVLVHELVHAFQFDILYNGSGISLLSGQGFFQMPLWFAEGMAEYLSLGGMESNADMFMRDGSLTGYLPPLEVASGYLVYKMGQSAITDLIDRHGEERFRELLRRARQMHNFDRAFEKTYDLPVRKFDEQWRERLRKRYWPTVASREHPEVYGKRLTDHRRDQSNVNLAPSISPQGDRIAFFSDRRQYTDVYIMSAFDGHVLRRVIRGERNVQFEAIPSFRSSITWSPDGTKLALVAKSAGLDRLYVVDATSGRIVRKVTLPCESLSFPAWSPVSDTLVVSGVKNGRSDLWLVQAGTGASSRLTDDTWDEQEPAWSPDGSRIVFSSDRLAPVVLQTERQPGGFGHYGLYERTLATGETQPLVNTSGEDHAPAWSPDGRRLAFLSDRGGAPNLYLYDPADRSITQLTDLLGGVFSLSWSHQNDRLVFAAFDRGGWDIFAVQEPLTIDPVMNKLRASSPGAVLSVEAALVPVPRDSLVESVHGALMAAWPDSVSSPDSSLAAGEKRAVRPHLDPRLDPRVAGEPPAWSGGAFPTPLPPPTEADTLKVTIPARTPLSEHGGPFALSDSVLSQPPTPYHWRLAPEALQGGVLAATGYGFVGSTQILFSDFLGDRSLYVATDVFANSLQETNALAIYSYLPKRWDWSVGAFHFKDYFQSRVTTLGEQLGSAQLFSERSFGALAGMSYPFDRFRRMDLQFTQMFVERTFFVQAGSGAFFESGKQYRSVSSPSLSLVGDNTIFGVSGPVNGGRYNVTYSPSFAWFENGLAYHTATLDVRRYWDLTSGYSFAFRSLNGASGGRDPQSFRVGGFSTLRGYPDFDILGNRIAISNVELRFPFVQQLGLVGPVPIGSFHIRGALFADGGFVWSDDTKPRLWRNSGTGRHLEDAYLSFGTGIRSWIFGLPMKLDVAWPTDLQSVRKPRWHFSIGSEF